MDKYSKDAVLPSIKSYSLNCLQLMNEYELEEYLNRSSFEYSNIAKNLIYSNAMIYDLACRPVLTNMILGSAIELSKRENSNISIRDLFIIYTQKWVQREEDKRKSKLLINHEKKSTFLRYLAMEMHLTGTLTISFKRIGHYIQNYFNLEDVETVDYFSHDIRTCSFLNRTKGGEYSFVHKSFMEFFVAQEYEMLEFSPFFEKYNKPLTQEMIDFIDSDNKLIKMLQDIFYEFSNEFSTLIPLVEEEKEQDIRLQDFEQAANWREIEKELKYLQTIDRSNLFITMDLKKLLITYISPLKKIMYMYANESGKLNRAINSKLILLLEEINSIV